jgi:hypothetical protein
MIKELSTLLLTDFKAHRFDGVIDTMKTLVKSGATRGVIAECDEPRLMDIYAVWLRGMTWLDFFQSLPSNKQSAEWKGWPWEIPLCQERSITRNLPPHECLSNISILFTTFPCLVTKGSEHEKRFKLLWAPEHKKREDGLVISIRAVKAIVQSAVAAKIALLVQKSV